MRTACILAALLVSVAGTIAARVPGKYYIEHLTPARGLSQSYVYDIVQDRRGFIWMGTRDGLNRFDGYQFTVERHHPFDTNTLSGISISSLTGDREGRIWAWTEVGLNRFDPRTHCVRRWSRAALFGSDDGKQLVLSMLGDRRGRVWIGSTAGLYLFNEHADSAVRVPITRSGNRDGVACITQVYEDRSGAVWACAEGNNVFRLDERTRVWRMFDLRGGRSTALRVCSEGERGDLLIGSDLLGMMPEQLYRVDPASGTVSCFPPIADNMRAYRGVGIEVICVDPDRTAWLSVASAKSGAIPSGVYAVPFDSIGRGHPSLTWLVPWRIIPGDPARSFCRDRTGVIWIGTMNGVYKLSPIGDRFATYRGVEADTTTLSCSRIRAIVKDPELGLWVGTDQGLNERDERSGRWLRHFNVVGDGTSEQDVGNVLYRDRDGRLLIGTNSGTAVYDRLNRRFGDLFMRYRGDSARYPLAVRSILRDRRGMLWLGTRDRGLFQFDAENRFVRRFGGRAGDRSAIGGAIIWCMYEARDGSIWIGTSSGAFRWRPSEGRFRYYCHRDGDAGSLSGDNICGIAEMENGEMLLAAHGAGVNRYNPGTDRFTSLTTDNGLPSNCVYSALPDGRGRIWISSNAGLAVYDPRTGTVRTYGVTDGLQSNEFSLNAYYRADDGTLLFGGVDGVNEFHPDRIRDNTVPPPMAILSYRVLDRPAADGLFDGDTLTVRYDQNFIAFEFAALDYVNPAGNHYAYMLEGFDRGWIGCGTRRYVSFTNLDPGTYVFRVKGTNNDGVWSARALSIVIRVVPPFWMTWWFRALLLLALLVAATAVVVRRLNTVRTQERLERRHVESQLHALRLQMNPHFIFNALGSIQHLIVKHEPWRAVEYLSKFARLVRTTLENSRQTFIPIAEEIASLELYLMLESLRFDGRFRYVIDTDPAIDRSGTLIPTMLIQPFVENAIRHGLLNKREGGVVTITLRRSVDAVRCIVEDDGIGRARAAEIRREGAAHRISFGIDVTRERLAMLQAMLNRTFRLEVTDLFAPDGSARGTRIEVTIPIEPAGR